MFLFVHANTVEAFRGVAKVSCIQNIFLQHLEDLCNLFEAFHNAAGAISDIVETSTRQTDIIFPPCAVFLLIFTKMSTSQPTR